jgi:hypothetical protein
MRCSVFLLSYQQVKDFFARSYLTLCCVPGSVFYFPAVFLRPNNRVDTNANSRARAIHERYHQFMFRKLRVEKGVAIVLSLRDCKMLGFYCIVWTFVSAVHLSQRPRRYFDFITITEERTKVRNKNMMNFCCSCVGVRMCCGSVVWAHVTPILASGICSIQGITRSNPCSVYMIGCNRN